MSTKKRSSDADKSYYNDHQNLIKKLLPRFQQVFPHSRFFERHVGLFYTVTGAPVKINKPGMSDVWFITKLGTKTIYLEMEFKTGKAVLSKNQKKWSSFLKSMGSQSFLVREDNFEDVVKKIRGHLELQHK